MSDALAGLVGAVYVETDDASVSFADEATTEVTATRFQITDTDKRFVDPDYTVTVKIGAVTQTSGYEIEYAGGVVVFDSSQTGETVTVSGYYRTLAESATIYGWSLDPSSVEVEDTTFKSAGDNGGWKTFMTTLRSWNVSFSGYYADDLFFAALNARVPVFVVCYTDSGVALERFEGLTILNGDGITNAVEAVVEESVSGVGHSGLYFREG